MRSAVAGIAALVGCSGSTPSPTCAPADPVHAATVEIGVVFASATDQALPVNTAQVVSALEDANGYLGPIDLVFDVSIVEDRRHAPEATAAIGQDLSTISGVPLTIWVVEDVVGAAGRSYGDDAFAIEWDEFGPNSAGTEIAHELLHVIGRMQHTFDGFDELVDGSNCETAGDGFCDTPADPGLLEENPQGCVWTAECVPECGVDANGDRYAPDANPHSYAPGHCVTPITDEQTEALAESLGAWLACRQARGA